jgi:type VI secretion system secreted protein Hcp
MPYPFYVTIDGQKQGKFGAEKSAGARGKNKIQGIKFLLETVSPRDASTGQASGKRMHKPIVFTKEWDTASPKLFQALVTNEVLKSVLFEFIKTNKNGAEFVHFKITLTNASIASIKSYVDLTDTTGDPYDAHELEDVELVFQKIELEDVEGKTTAVDDWAKAVA